MKKVKPTALTTSRYSARVVYALLMNQLVNMMNSTVAAAGAMFSN